MNNATAETEDPVQNLVQDRNTARDNGDFNADISFLATTDSTGHAQVRTIVLRDIIDRKFGIFLNQNSPKWEQLNQNGGFQLLLFYPTVMKQYRLSGKLTDMDPQLVADSWQLRPDGSKYMDYYYNEVGTQSTPIDSRTTLMADIEQLKSRLGNAEDLLAPANAIGLYLEMDRIDRLDLSDPNRIHDRRIYQFSGDRWQEQVVVP